MRKYKKSSILMKSGLSTREANKRLLKFGKNVLKSTNPNPLWKMLMGQFTDLMVMILMVSAIIAIAFGIYEGDDTGLIDGYVILGIVILNATIGFFQEYKAEKALEALKKMISPNAIVIRNGKKSKISAENVVPGDIIVLTAGDKLVADGKLLISNEIKVDESALTGESVPVHKQGKDEVSMGTTVVAGSGMMEVMNTGMKTRFGRIAHLTTTTVKDKSPLQKEMFHIGVFVTKVTVLISGVLILAGVFVQGKHFLESLLFAVSVAVAAVPEGLPATITVALALGVQKMVKKNAVVKKLSSIETLGSTTVICSDKTGTLTQNEMTVTKLLLGDSQVLSVSGTGYDPGKGKIQNKKIKRKEFLIKNLEKIRLIATHCTESELVKKGKRYEILGDPTEVALISLANKRLDGKDKKIRLKKRKILHHIPFDSERKMMSIILKEAKSHEIWTKGAPDELLKRCKRILINGEIKTMTSKHRKNILQNNAEMASEALRVIGFAYRPMKTQNKAFSNGKKLEKDMVFVGLAGMIDPPREAVPKAVSLCHKAGIRTIIVTGDNGLTAKAIAKQIGIANGDTPIISGEDIEKMTDKKLSKILEFSNRKKQSQEEIKKASIIFSRVNPEHKRRIVDLLKIQGEIVAVTGDGVNDAPALKRADLGIAMGITGTEVSKETANMILLDDSFASIITSIREGRKIYDNLKKFTWFIFSCNTGELLTVFSAIIFQFPAPLTAVLILAVDLGTDILPAIALGVDHAEPDTMNKAPRDQNIRIMNKRFVIHFLYIGIVIGAVVIGIYIWELMRLGWSFGEELKPFEAIHIKAASLAFSTLVIIQLFNAFNARSLEHSVFKLRSLWQLWASVAVSVVLVAVIIYVPFFQTIFRTTGLDMYEWMIILGAGGSILLIEEMRKLGTRMMAKE